MKARTKSEKEAMIAKLEALKKSLPQFNYFGDDNWRAIDLQIEIIDQGLLDEDDLYDKQDMGDLSSDEVSSGIDALQWLEGMDNDLGE